MGGVARMGLYSRTNTSMRKRLGNDNKLLSYDKVDEYIATS